jgi:hypothetical protein
MKTSLKIKLGALAVITNGLLALTLSSPKAAFAQSCGPVLGCLRTCTQAQSYCESYAPSGCTYVSNTCDLKASCLELIPYGVTCNYT